VSRRLQGKVSPAFLALAEGLMVQSNGLFSVTSVVDDFGGFAAQYDQIEKVSAHHGDNWEVLLHGHLKGDRPVMLNLLESLGLVATSEDSRVLDALEHLLRFRNLRDHIPVLGKDDEGRDTGRVDISFATQNWQKIVRDRTRPGSYVRRHFEAMVFVNLADKLRCGDVAVTGSEEYADCGGRAAGVPGGGRIPGSPATTGRSTRRRSAPSCRTGSLRRPRPPTPGIRRTRACSSTRRPGCRRWRGTGRTSGAPAG
jgi:hypothetical protein